MPNLNSFLPLQLSATFFLFLVGSLIANVAVTQDITRVETEATIEFAVASSSVVVRAKVVGYEKPEAVTHGWWKRVPVTIRLKPSVWYKGVEAEEVLFEQSLFMKDGKPREDFKDTENQIKNLIESEEEQVWFLNSIEEHFLEDALPNVHLAYFDLNYSLRLFDSEDQKKRYPSMKLGLRCHNSDEAFHSAIEEACKENFQLLNAWNCWNPVRNDQSSGTRWLVTVVGGNRLEKLAINMIRKPERFLNDHEGRKDIEFQTGLTRVTGLNLMPSFRSPENIDLVKTMLTDKCWWVGKENLPDGESLYLKEYCVHDAAINLLRTWGVPMEQLGSDISTGFEPETLSSQSLSKILKTKTVDKLYWAYQNSRLRRSRNGYFKLTEEER